MDIEDAEYQEWVNIQEDCTTKPLDNKRVLCEYWSLKNDPARRTRRKFLRTSVQGK